ncbi:unnamed protein product [Camellia sinensis]|uniref:protein HYPER-SENSITIVITY-RELATED 4-like n=1 Tax=Camellia sinensis TaxID=4442 RepID=UPI0010363C41|nr:protein HYPER-SENSITIVITY-RELATED 4-like [Camellia sinensis]
MSVFPQNMSMPSISISSVLFTALAVMVGTLLNEALAITKKLIPQQLLLSKLESLIGKYYSQMTLIIDEHINGVSINEMFQASEIYLCAKISPSVERLKVSKALGEEALRVTVDQGERIVDTYIGIQLTWQMICAEKTKTSTDNEIVEYRSIELSFYKKYTEMVLSTYLPYVLERSKAMKEENKIGKLYSCKGSRSSVNLNHPSTFHTLVTDPSMKKKLMDDLNGFLKRGEFYWKVGKARKRGYFLYDTLGTSKSRLIATIANYFHHFISCNFPFQHVFKFVFNRFTISSISLFVILLWRSRSSLK